MDYSKQQIEDYLIKYTATLSQDQIKKQKKDLIDKIISTQVIPGYRKGKAPSYIVASKFKEYIEENIQEQTLTKLYDKIIKDEKKDPLHFELEEYDLEKGLLVINIEFMPELDVKDYKGLAIEEVKLELLKEHVDKAYSDILKNFSSWQDYEGPVEDEVLIELEDYLEEVPGEEPRKMDKFPVIYSETKEPKEFYGELKSLKKADVKEFVLDFKEDASERFKNKKVKYSFKVGALKKKLSPKEDEELFSKMVEGAKSKEDVMKKLGDDIKKNSELEMKRNSVDKIYSVLIEKNPFTVPPRYLERMKDEVYESENEKYKKNYGMSMEQLNISKDSMTDDIVKGIRINHIRKHILDLEKLEVTDSDIDEQFQMIADSNNISLDGVKSFYNTNKSYLDNVKNDLLSQKVDDLLYSSAKIKKVKPKVEKKEEPSAPKQEEKTGK
ncbi:hypothetical protein KAI78_08890 [bacterium]|nr:hypothetical protein [bacterium]